MAPMCGIKDSMKPSIPIEYILKFLLNFFPNKQWVPGSDGDFIKKCSPNLEYQNAKNIESREPTLAFNGTPPPLLFGTL